MIQNGITFNSVKTGALRMSQWPFSLMNQQGPDEDGGIINAVDIDWNQAILPNADLATGNGVTINTTGDLLNLINEMQKEIYVLSAAICALSGN